MTKESGLRAWRGGDGLVDYCAASLLAANYFHYISCSKIHWPRYLGAIYWAEASLPHVNARMARTVGRLAPKADITYLREHVEIDAHHRRMVLENVIAPLAGALGEEWIPGVLRGFEEFRVVGELVGRDWCAWIDILAGDGPRVAVQPAGEDAPGAPGKPVEGGEPGVIDTPESLEGRPEDPS